ncbi:TPA: hypothetical protein ACG4NT_000078 [Stenotrophomonas maltophilia]
MREFYITPAHTVCDEKDGAVRFIWSKTYAGFHIFNAAPWVDGHWSDDPYKLLASDCSVEAAIEAWEELEERLLTADEKALDCTDHYDYPNIWQLYELSAPHWSADAVKW